MAAMTRSTRTFRLFKGLWSSESPDYPSFEDKLKDSPENSLIDEICFKADLCENYEDYINTLCQGMILILDAGIPRRYLEEHPLIKDKVHNMGGDILSNSHQDSDQLYVGLFVVLKVKADWLKVKFYKIIQNMMHHVLDHGLKISDNIKSKIKEQIHSQYFQLYKSLFLIPSKLHSF
jgi:hypothetical protein